MKTCSKCREEKPQEYFSKNKRARDGLFAYCKKCSRENAAAWGAANPEKVKASGIKWRAENPEKYRARAAKWREANPGKVRDSKSKWYSKNRDKCNARSAAWYLANREKIRLSEAEKYAANPEIAKARSTKWCAENKDKRMEYVARWREVNKDKAIAYNAAWRIANPELLRIYRQNRRARKLASGGKISKGIIEKLFKLQRGKCACCGEPLGDDYHLDHIMPLVLGGPNIDSNIQLLRSTCNQQKHAKHPIDFMQQRGFLL